MQGKTAGEDRSAKEVAIKCPHCGAALTKRRGWKASSGYFYGLDEIKAAMTLPKPPPEGPSIGRQYSKAEIEKEMAAGKAKLAKAKRDGIVQFKG